jgi:hypothetical protein
LPTHFTRVLQALLASGETVRFTAPGHSMHPMVRHGDVLVVEPLRAPALIGDILLYIARGRPVAHRLIAFEPDNGSVAMILKGDSAVQPDLPVQQEQVIGRVAAIERRGRKVNPSGVRFRAAVRLHAAAGSMWDSMRASLQRRAVARLEIKNQDVTP